MFDIGNLSRFTQSLILLLCVGSCAGVAMHVVGARADDMDPFANTQANWMSFERYNDNIKRNRPVGNEAISLPKIEMPNVEPAQELPKTLDNTVQNETQVQGLKPEAMVAAPTRALDLPILPAINSDYNVPVETTLADDNSNASAAQIVQRDDGKSDIHLKEQNWQDAAEMARQRADEKNGITADSDHAPLDVRLSFLPDPKIIPIFNAPKKPRIRMVEVPTAPKPVTAPPPAPEAPKTAECAAVDLYKKKQLEAIQSDRQTLQALQDAIADLGLQKQLNFMTGSRQTPISASMQQPGATVTATP